ncbi:MAG: integrin [Hydrogenophaga sp.]|uniref:integrin n=1 Tax=Hydrogenophaga sp. TaxID=1904254 RepID=UPI0016A67676|nr:integrin [Hydrogenophaga sp.]NIM43118.1 integrin [Hydrogenophaga sp.]NIN28186.1 integrin [Hydrogenophaga sp.]NIN30624.1 integrin [Hydrogenophaga sp.]NIN57321.1 integrin [Hydrogenophaga sp.]NIO51540.1 integrin [Hydrogenophaga sp.]
MKFIRFCAVRASLLLVACAVVACGGGSSAEPSSASVRVPAVAASTSANFSLTPTAIKSFHFTWNDMPDETGYRLLEDPDGASGYTPIAELPADTTQYEHPVFLPDRVNARYRLQTCQNQHCVDTAELGVNDRLVPAIGYVKAAAPADRDLFGGSVALSANGQYLAVGASGYDSASSNIGSVHVFAREGTTWRQRAVLQGLAPQQHDKFGASLALSAQGDTLAVGAPGEGNPFSPGVPLPVGGTVYVFARTGDSWGLQQAVNALNADTADRFGEQVALSGDGDTLAVGAPLEAGSANTVNGPDNNDLRGSGAAYVFTRAGGAWTQQAYVKVSHPDAFDNFGRVLALSADGQTLAVGAIGDDSAARGVGGDPSDNTTNDSGAVYVFARQGDRWGQQAYVKASNARNGAWFGSAIALSADGQVMAVGSQLESSEATGIDGDQDNTGADRSGAAYVFARRGAQWRQTSYLKASNTGARDFFGSSVALSADGKTLAVGTPGEDSDARGLQGEQDNDNANSSGAVYLFRHTSAGWRQQAYVKASNTQRTSVSDFGRALALAGRADGLGDQGMSLAVGCPYAANNSSGVGGDQGNAAGEDVGAVYLY